MKKILFVLITVLFASFAADTFEYDKKTGIAKADGKYQFTMIYDKRDDHWLVSNEQSQNLIVIRYIRYNDLSQANQSNPTGSTAYLEWVFPTIGKKGESKSEFGKTVPRSVYRHNLVRNGQLDTAAVSNFIFINGNTESEKMKAILRR